MGTVTRMNAIRIGDKVFHGEEIATVATINYADGYATVMAGPFATFHSVQLYDLVLAPPDLRVAAQRANMERRRMMQDV